MKHLQPASIMGGYPIHNFEGQSLKHHCKRELEYESLEDQRKPQMTIK